MRLSQTRADKLKAPGRYGDGRAAPGQRWMQTSFSASRAPRASAPPPILAAGAPLDHDASN
jgi:hypothetical protein